MERSKFDRCGICGIGLQLLQSYTGVRKGDGVEGMCPSITLLNFDLYEPAQVG